MIVSTEYLSDPGVIELVELLPAELPLNVEVVFSLVGLNKNVERGCVTKFFVLNNI